MKNQPDYMKKKTPGWIGINISIAVFVGREKALLNF